MVGVKKFQAHNEKRNDSLQYENLQNYKKNGNDVY